MPGLPQVGVFDTAFHQTMPAKAYMYAIPYELYEKYGVRRYGFHGTSHRYVSARALEFLGMKAEGTKMITLLWLMASALTPQWVSPRWKVSSWVLAQATSTVVL